MSVKMAVLGLVIERPGYGYQLQQRLRERTDGMRVSEAAVYPALASLAKAGHIRETDRTGTDHRRRIWYDHTPDGVDHFERWMAASSALEPVRGSVWFKIAMATVDTLPMVIEDTREQEQACLDEIDRLTRALSAPIDLEANWGAPIGRIALERANVRVLEAQIQALQEARAEMKRALRRHAARPSE